MGVREEPSPHTPAAWGALQNVHQDSGCSGRWIDRCVMREVKEDFDSWHVNRSGKMSRIRRSPKVGRGLQVEETTWILIQKSKSIMEPEWLEGAGAGGPGKAGGEDRYVDREWHPCIQQAAWLPPVGVRVGTPRGSWHSNTPSPGCKLILPNSLSLWKLSHSGMLTKREAYGKEEQIDSCLSQESHTSLLQKLCAPGFWQPLRHQDGIWGAGSEQWEGAAPQTETHIHPGKVNDCTQDIYLWGCSPSKTNYWSSPCERVPGINRPRGWRGKVLWCIFVIFMSLLRILYLWAPASGGGGGNVHLGGALGSRLLKGHT